MDERDFYQGRNQDVEQFYPAAPGAPFYGPPPKKRMSRGRKILLLAVMGILLLAVLIVAGIVVDRILFPTEQKASEFELDKSLSYEEALDDIKRYYYGEYSQEKITKAGEEAVKKEKDKGAKSVQKLEDAGLRAMMKALDDNHSSYLTADENRRLNEDISGSFYGVGFMLREDEEEERPKIVSVIKGSPSDRAGVKKEDMIMSVDGKDTKGVSIDVVVTWIRGKRGTKVELKIKRPGTGKELTFKITREKIEIPELETEVLDDRYGHLRVFNFSKGISEKVRNAVRELSNQGVQGFILDLRSNPGGLLDEAVKMARVFINEGMIVSYQTKGSDMVNENAEGDAETDLPLVVLINGGSASSSEIVAGALQDRGRATLVGGKSFGKGSVQKVYDLENKGAVKLTVAMYYLPNGESINGKGIEPDVVVEYEDDLDKEEQLQLEKAKEVLNNLIQGKPATGEALRPAA